MEMGGREMNMEICIYILREIHEEMGMEIDMELEIEAEMEVDRGR